MDTVVKRGYYTRQLEKTADNAKSLVKLARKANLSQILVKIADGENPYQTTTSTMIADLLAQSSGPEVWGWAAVYPDRDPVAQAKCFAKRLNELNLQWGVIYAVDLPKKAWSAQVARQYMDMLVKALPLTADDNKLLGLATTYPLNQQFPFSEFAGYCKAILPQISLSTLEGSPNEKLQYIVDTYQRRFFNRLIIPTAVASGEVQTTDDRRFYWTVRDDQVTNFLNQCGTLGLPAVNFWSWQDVYGDQRVWQQVATWKYQAPQTIVIPTDTGAAQQQAAQVTSKDNLDISTKPGEVFIDVPYYSQLEAGANRFGNDCGPTCMRMLIGWIRKVRGQEDDRQNPTVDQVVVAARVANQLTDLSQNAAIGAKYGLQMVLSNRKDNPFTMEKIIAELDARRPVFCLIIYGAIKRSKRQFVYAGGHYVLAVGYNDTEVILNDPLWARERVQEGKGFRVTREEFQDAITRGQADGVVYFGFPQGMFVDPQQEGLR